MTRLRPFVIGAIGCHSLLLGIGMLCWPAPLCLRFGFDTGGSTFYASQSGIFLVILGLCYLRALLVPALGEVIIISKAAAVAFLVVWAVRTGPPILWAAAAGDAAMLGAALFCRRGGTVRGRTILPP